MNEKIFKALNHHFLTNRVVFWYDDGGKMKDVYMEYDDPGIEKIVIENNEFYIRYLIQKLEPEKRFLVYSESAKPADEENWLLDINLSNFVFASDEASMYLQELDLDDRLMPYIRKYIAFFRNKKERLIPLKAMINPSADTEEDLILAMISVFAGSLKNFTDAAVNLFIDYFLSDSREMWENICKYKLDYDFWILAEKEFYYSNASTSLDGLLNHILKNAFDFQMKKNRDPVRQNLFSIVDVWRNSLKYSSSFREILEKKEKELNIAHEFSKNITLSSLVEADIFKEADRQIFQRLLDSLENRLIDLKEALHIIERRRESYWYKSEEESRLKDHYKTLYHYLCFMELYSRANPDFKTLNDGWIRYTGELYLLDSHYRSFIHYYNLCGAGEIFANLIKDLDNRYTEGYMRTLSDSWQKALDREKTLAGLTAASMTRFFDRYVSPYLNQDLFLFVVISDGMRYEIGAELCGRIEMQNRFKVSLESIIAPVPSYTQAGMAALLPHQRLEIAEDGNTVLADSRPVTGLENREKILQAWLDARYSGKKAKTLNAKEFLDRPMAEQEEFIRGVDLVYLYSSGVDSTGESPKSEKNLPDAAEREIRFICDLSRKIVNLNRTHILITADHGYLYRYNPVPEAEWIKIDVSENEVRRDHRFIMGNNLKEHPGADIISRDKLLLESPYDLMSARGVSLIKRPGGGSRYVHGGRMLQELCVPLLVLKKSREDDVSSVEVSVIDRKSDITTGQISIRFIQETPAGGKKQPREIAAVFESGEGKELSAVKIMIFDSRDPIDQNRSRTETFVFGRDADAYNGKTVYLKLYEIRPGNTKVPYREYTYSFRKTIKSDFEF